MRAFLSHSSKDKGLVEAAAGFMKPGQYELDSETFDAGLLNSQAIAAALKRSDLFCLFLSSDSVNSAYVDFETLLGTELLAAGAIKRFVAICLDDAAFAAASAQVRYFNILRRGLGPESIARIVQGQLIAAASQNELFEHPFIGREEDLKSLEQQANDTARPALKALFVSGNFGSGRRTLVGRFYQLHYPNVGRLMPTVLVDEFAGFEELHRRVIAALRPSTPVRELLSRSAAFAVSSTAEQARQIAELINAALVASEAVLMVDQGGLLQDSGQFQPEIDAVLDHLRERPHPPLAMVATRMIPLKLRRAKGDVAHVALQSLERGEALRLASKLLKDLGIRTSKEDLTEIVTLGDGHPFNFYRLAEELSERGVDTFLADPSDFINWKHRQSSEYLQKITFSAPDIQILGLLKLLPSIDFPAITAALPLAAEEASESLVGLLSKHIVEQLDGVFSLSPPLRVAVERDKRIVIPFDQRRHAVDVLAQTLAIRIEEGSAPLALVDSAILTSVQANVGDSVVTAGLLLPSHYVWLSKRNYDQRHYDECIRLSREALRSADRLSASGRIAACRYLCLAGARVGDKDAFGEGLGILERMANDRWARSNIAFLRGFNERMKGNLPEAERHFADAETLSPDNISATRELASVSLLRGNLVRAEQFARAALSHARRNPFVVDILVAVLIRKLGQKALRDPELIELLDVLEEVSNEDDRSFYSTRMAEIEHRWGDNKKARRLIEEAIDLTPTIFEPRRIYAEILLKDGNKGKAHEVIEWMKRKVEAREPSEQRSNYRPYLETYSHYLTEVGRWSDAKAIFNDRQVFTDEERREAVRQIEIAQGFGTR